MDKVMFKASYVRAGSSPGTYVKRSADGKGLCIAVTHVDDVRGIACDPVLINDIRAGLKDRFDEITEEEGCVQEYAGITISVNPVSRAVKCSQSKYINNVALRIGITHLPANVDTPCSADFFEPSVTVDDCKAVDSSQYMKLTGSLVHALSTRDEIRHLVSFLCTKNSAPNAGDFAKAIHVLRYLYSTRDLGRVYDSDSTEVFAYSDSAFNSLPNGRSSTAFFFCVGRDNAPFYSVAKAQETVAPDIMSGEYISGSACCRFVNYVLEILSDIGEPAKGPIILFLDSNTAINLAHAPFVTKKSRHIERDHHYMRDLTDRKKVKPTHVPARDQRADVMSKYLPRAPFFRGRDGLLNSNAFCAVFLK